MHTLAKSKCDGAGSEPKYFDRIYTCYDFQLLEQKEITINGQPAFITKYSETRAFVDSPSSFTYYGWDVIIPIQTSTQSQLYAWNLKVSMIDDGVDKYEQIMNDMLYSFTNP